MGTVTKSLIAKEDLNIGKGTFQRLNSQGGVETLNKINIQIGEYPSAFENKAELTAFTDPQSIAVALVLGHTTKGDGGAFTAYFVSGDTTTETPFIFADDANTGRWFFTSGAINVKQAGAVGDGVTDDTAAIQAAITYATANLGAVYIPSGIYKVSASLTASGNDVVIVGEAMESVFIEATSAVTGAILDINPGGASRYSRGYIANMKLIGAKAGSNPHWYDDTYYSSAGLQITDVVNGMTIERIRVLKTNTYGIALLQNTWFNSIRDTFAENCKGDGLYIGTNSNGVHVSGHRSYLTERGMTIADSFSVNLSGCGFEDTNAEGLTITGQSVVAIQGTWFEDHGEVTLSAGAISIAGVVGDTTRPANLSLNGTFFNSVGDHVIKAANSTISLHACQSDNATIDVFDFDSDTTIYDDATNRWAYTGDLYTGAGFPAGLIDYDATWTPVISDASSGGNTATFDANASSQRYYKKGNEVLIQCRLENIDTTGMTSGNVLYIQGLPLASSANCHASGSCELSGITISGSSVTPVIVPSTTTLYLLDNNTDAAYTTIKVSDVFAATSDIKITIRYLIG